MYNLNFSYRVSLNGLKETLEITKKNPLYLIRKTKKGYIAGIAIEQSITNAKHTIFGLPVFEKHQFVEDSCKYFPTYEEAQAYVDSLSEQKQEPLKLRTSLL